MRHWLRHWFPLQRYGEYRADVVSGLRAPLFLLVRITPAGKVQDSVYVLLAQSTLRQRAASGRELTVYCLADRIGSELPWPTGLSVR